MERLKELRLKRGLTQAEVAKHLKVDRTTLTKYETGEREPDLENLLTLASYFDVSVDYLLGKSDIPNPIFDPVGDYFRDVNPKDDEEIEVLNRAARKWTPEQRKRALNILKASFDDFDWSN